MRPSVLEETRDRRGRTAPAETREDHAIHLAADAGDVRRVRELLDAEPTLLNRGDCAGGTLCRDSRTKKRDLKCAAMLLDAGATISARDDDYCSTPLGWAARNNYPEMVRFLLSRGAPTNLPDDKPWATPLAWAIRRGHTEIVQILRAAGATA